MERIGTVSYRLELPQSLSSVHDVFHISMLRKHLRDEEQQQVSDLADLDLHPDFSTVELPVRILARETKSSGTGSFPWSRCSGAAEASRSLRGSVRRTCAGIFRSFSRRRYNVV